eukprot:361574-Chlamydomonas_euryale.AAC.8
MDGGSGGKLEVTHSNCLRCIAGTKLTDRHRLETTREQSGTSSLELMDRRRTLQWMGHVLRMDEYCLPRQTFLGCTALQPGGAMRKVPVVALLFGAPSSCMATLDLSLGQRPEQRRRNVPWTGKPYGTLLKTLLCGIKKPQEAGRMTRSCARRGGSG